MIGWLIALAILLLFLLLKVGVRVFTDSEDMILNIHVGLLRFALSTQKKD